MLRQPVNHQPESPAVLIVDDQPALRRIMADLVSETFNAEAVTARDGREGVARLREAAERVRLVLLDVEMPEMDGVDALKQVRAIDPGLPIIICTGLPPAAVQARLDGTPVTAVLNKPFDLEDFLDEVARSLEPASA